MRDKIKDESYFHILSNGIKDIRPRTVFEWVETWALLMISTSILET